MNEHIDIVKTCYIYLEPSDTSHPPTRLNATNDACKNIFDGPWLREWCMVESETRIDTLYVGPEFSYSGEDEDSDEEVSDDSSDDGSAVSKDEEI